MSPRQSRSKAEELVVFLGPSLSEQKAKALAPCTVLPPARQGDVWRVLARRPRAICLIDGVFGAVPSVWHHEILAALDAGVAVFGAASMGALRAAELWRQGMVGVGQVFTWYRDGVLEDDSEVALLHGGPEHGFEAFSLPLVNVRHNAARAKAAGALTAGQARELVAAGARLFYQDRTWARVLAETSWKPALRTRWQTWAERHLEDLKRLDAEACIAAAREFLAAAPKAVARAPKGNPSSLVRRRRIFDAKRDQLHELGDRLDAPELVDEGLRTLLLAGWARELGLVVTDAERAEAERLWWFEQRIPKGARPAFLASLGLDAAETRSMFETLALEEKVLANAARMLNDGPSEDEALVFAANRRGLPPT